MIALVYMASGFGRRYGANKLMEVYHGKPLYEHGLSMLRQVKRMLGEDGHSVRICTVTNQPDISYSGYLVGVSYENPQAQEGIAASVRVGVKAAHCIGAQMAVFFVADQPWLTADSVYCFLNDFIKSEKGIGRLTANGKPGNPVAFKKQYFDELREVSGDKGGRQVIRRHPDDLMEVEVEEKELWDIDCPGDWRGEKLDISGKDREIKEKNMS
ncbi:MAG: nucleotidyltransferase family protein [bacterium]|nr:nucleotidyltransferase family protein [bacterium]